MNRRSTRHTWKREAVQVPWSSAPASLRTCTRCGMTRQSVPDERGGSWRLQFGIPTGAAGKYRYIFSPSTPPCTPAYRTQDGGGSSAVPRVRAGVEDLDQGIAAESPDAAGRRTRLPTAEQVRMGAMSLLWALVEGARETRPPEGMSAAEALKVFAFVVDKAAREHFGESWDVFVAAEESIH